jgi:rod shape-determining protein MreD
MQGYVGAIKDAMTEENPTHIFSLMFVGYLTSRLQKTEISPREFYYDTLVTFGMAVVGETVMAL